GSPFRPPLVDAAEPHAQARRQAAAGMYSGILASGAMTNIIKVELPIGAVLVVIRNGGEIFIVDPEKTNISTQLRHDVPTRIRRAAPANSQVTWIQ
ncbi:MAG TPA: hypothetical protein VFC19_22415, partial [Candidatus Limnocylindrales bacterium]|nr:hypothetical protein [Candidatus Limnocylindrales bacterium]